MGVFLLVLVEIARLLCSFFPFLPFLITSSHERVGNRGTPNGGSRALIESKLPRNATGLPHRGGGRPSVMVLHALGNSQDRALCPDEYVGKSTPHDPAIGYRAAGYVLRNALESRVTALA